MSEHHRGAWGTRDEAMWWPGAIAADQQTLQHHQHLLHQQQLAVQQQAQIDAANSSASATQQLFSYKMASSFQNPTTTVSNATSTSPVGAAGIRGYDYGMTGGNPTMSAPAPAAQWWYPPGNMDNMHNTLLNAQNLQNNMQHLQQQSQQQHQQQQQPQQNMPPVQTPPPPVSWTSIF